MNRKLVRLLADCYKLLKPPPKLTVWQWAERYRRLPKSVTARPGKYKTSTAPFQKEPQEMLTDSSVSTVALMFASRLGKTEVTMNLIGYTASHNPRHILFVKPTMADVDKWSKQSLTPMIDSSPVLRRLFAAPRSRDSGNTIFSKRFPGGQIGMIGSNSTSAFRGIQAPVVICDEIDDYTSTSQGDAVALAFKRAENYNDSIQIVTSTPTYKHSSRIEEFYEKSDQRKWFIPCPHCRNHFVLLWAHVKWPKGKPELATVECPLCQGTITDEQRLEAVMAGEWRATATAEQPTLRGYWLNGLNSPFPAKKGFANKLHQFVSEFLEADAQGTESLKVWTNTFLAETWEDKGDKIEPGSLMSRREGYGPQIPEGCYLLVAAVDVQQDRLEAEVVGYGENEETWGIEYVQFWGNPERDEIWKQLDDWLLKPREHVNGAQLKIAAAGVDCGYKTKRVLEWCRPRIGRRVWPLKGSKTSSAPLITRPKIIAGRVPIWGVGTDTAKETLMSRIQLKEVGPRYCHFPMSYTDEYFLQLTAEEVRTFKRNGFVQRLWFKHRARNEALDIRVYTLAVFEILYPQMPAIRKQVEAAATRKDYRLDPNTKLADSATKPTPPPPPVKPSPLTPGGAKAQTPARTPFVRPRGGWMGGAGRF